MKATKEQNKRIKDEQSCCLIASEMLRQILYNGLVHDMVACIQKEEIINAGTFSQLGRICSVNFNRKGEMIDVTSQEYFEVETIEQMKNAEISQLSDRIMEFVDFLAIGPMTQFQTSLIHYPAFGSEYASPLWWWGNLDRIKTVLIISAFLTGQIAKKTVNSKERLFEISTSIVSLKGIITKIENNEDLLADMKKTYTRKCDSAPLLVEAYNFS